jgi:exodeoxyribonuclease-3
MKIIAWNVNGIRASLKTGEMKEMLEKEKPHIFCIGETKLSCNMKSDIDKEIAQQFSKYKYRYWSTCSTKGGYSGTAIWCKKEPLNITYGLQYKGKELDTEGRIIVLELEKYFLLHVYTPNSGQALNRLEFRTKEWDRAFEIYINMLQEKKPIIICVDLNVARMPIDLANPKTNTKTAGYTKDERESFENILKKCNIIDTFREMNSEMQKYSFWSYMRNAREKNIGWRIDYFLVSSILLSKVKKSDIMEEIYGSDHAPIFLEIKK